MLCIKRENPKTVIVPCYNNNLIWHSHQQYVLYYQADMKHFLENILNHDDTNSDASKQQKNRLSTKLIWEKTHSMYEVNGGMLRGEPPLPNLNMDRFFFFCSTMKLFF